MSVVPASLQFAFWISATVVPVFRAKSNSVSLARTVYTTQPLGGLQGVGVIVGDNGVDGPSVETGEGDSVNVGSGDP